MSKVDYNKLAKDIHQQNVDVGWWDGEQCIFTKLQLVSTEIAEATEGERKNLMDDHLPTRKMGEVELADAVIRMLDIGGKLGLEYERGTLDYTDYPLMRDGAEIAAMHLGLNLLLADLTKTITGYICSELLTSIKNDFKGIAEDEYSQFVDTAVEICNRMGYDLEGAMMEKLEYNKSREDHKKENRDGEYGKKF